MRGLTVEEEVVLRSCASVENHFDAWTSNETHERLRSRGLVCRMVVDVGPDSYYRYDVTDLGRLALRTPAR